MFVAFGIRCLADVSSVSPSSEQPVSTTNPQIRTVTYCTRLPTHLTLKTQFRTPNFSDSVGSAAKIQTLTPNATKCPISFPNVAIRTASCLKHSIGSKTSIENRL